MGENKERMLALVPRLAGRRVMVVGDVVADRYVLAEPARLSREAPVIVTRYVGERLIPGGAANAMNNLQSLGAEVIPIGIVGRDTYGRQLRDELGRLGMDTGGVIEDDDYTTVTKTRILVGDPDRSKQQLLRIDREPTRPPEPARHEELLARVRERLPDVHAVLLSDYGYGAITPALADLVRADAGPRIVAADSRYQIRSFRGLTLATPNEGEVEECLGMRVRSEDDLERAGRTLLSQLACACLVVTRGNRGMSVFRPGQPRVDVPAAGSGQVTDVSGAGDTVIAVATLALAAGADFLDAARLANLAAGIVVTKIGAATCSPAELVHAGEEHL